MTVGPPRAGGPAGRNTRPTEVVRILWIVHVLRVLYRQEEGIRGNMRTE